MKPVDYVNIRPDFTAAHAALVAGTATPKQQALMARCIEWMQRDAASMSGAFNHARGEFQRAVGLAP